MRKLVVAAISAIAFAGVLLPPANASSSPSTSGGVSPSSSGGTSSQLSMAAQITRFRATRHGVVADGIFTGKLHSGHRTSRDSAPVRFKVVSRPHNGHCNVITLHLAPLDLELLGVQVQTSTINLNITAVRGRVLGDLFCALSHAKVVFPHAAQMARSLNSRLGGHSLRVFSATQSFPAHTVQTRAADQAGAATQGQSCQVLKVVLGPLHLDLLGLVVDLYGKTRQKPVVVTITADPNKGLLGQILCGLAGGTSGITSVSGLQNLLNTLGLNLDLTQIQKLLNSLGIDLSGGLTQADLNKILQALGLGSSVPSG